MTIENRITMIFCENYIFINFDIFPVYASSKSEEVGVAALMSQEQVSYLIAIGTLAMMMMMMMRMMMIMMMMMMMLKIAIFEIITIIIIIISIIEIISGGDDCRCHWSRLSSHRLPSWILP